MSHVIFNYDEAKAEILKKWIGGRGFLKDEEKELLLNISLTLIKNRDELLRIYDEISTEEEHFLHLNNEKLELSLENKKKIVSVLIDFSEEILPLGSVVVLKDDFIRARNSDEEVKIIITHRFLANEKSNIYFTYSGTVYPAGNLLQNKLIHFNEKSIKKICFKGFSDEVDKAYVLSMKNNLLFNKKFNSINFADDRQIEIFKDEARKDREV